MNRAIYNCVLTELVEKAGTNACAKGEKSNEFIQHHKRKRKCCRD